MVAIKDNKVTWEITPDLIDDVVETIRRECAPHKIILFGSAAWDDPGNARDLDLLVIMDTDRRPHKRAAPIHMLFSPYPCPMDILVFTPAEVRYWNGTVGHIITEAMRTGRVVYDRSA